LTVIVAVIAYFTLHDFPETATFLTEEERAFVVYRLKYQDFKDEREDGAVRVAQDDSFQWKYVKAAFLDWQIWTNIWVYWGMFYQCISHLILTTIGIVCPLYGISLFLPSIIRGLGYTSSTAQLLTVPIYITASVLAVTVAWYSDRVGKRYPFILVCMCIMAVGFIMCVASATPGVIYAGVFIAACALYPAFPGNITWLSNSELFSSQAVICDMLIHSRSCWIYQASHRSSHTDRRWQSRRRYVSTIYCSAECSDNTQPWLPTFTGRRMHRGIFSGTLSSSASLARVLSHFLCWCSTTSASTRSARGRWRKGRTTDIRRRSWQRWAIGRLRIDTSCRLYVQASQHNISETCNCVIPVLTW
jgi:hypothetical protein